MNDHLDGRESRLAAETAWYLRGLESRLTELAEELGSDIERYLDQAG